MHTEVQRRLDEQAASLDQLLQQNEAHATTLKAQLAAVEAENQRIKNAIKELRGEKRGPGRPKSALAAHKAKRSGSSTPPSKASIAAVRQVIRERDGDGGITKLEISAATGLSHDTIRRALNHLRDNSEIRHGTSRERKLTYRVMPNAGAHVA